MKFFSKKSKNRKSNVGKKVLIVSGMMLALFMVAPMTNNQALNTFTGTIEAHAAESTFSEFWFQDTDGSWKVKDGSGNVVKNCWLCDDAVASNGQNIWYLIDGNGNMISAGLVKDSAGNYYSIETNHNGFYGMMRYQSGTYDGINLSLESSHSGRFGAILNQDGLSTLQSKYGVKDISNISTACVYTSTFRSGSSGGSSHSSKNNNSSSQQISNSVSSNKSSSSGAPQIVDGSLGMLTADETSALWDAEAQHIAEEVGKNMAH